MTIDELLSLTWFKRAVDILLSPFLFVRFLIRLISSNFCWKVISSPVLRGGEGRRATTWLTLPDAMVKVDEVPWTFPALDDALVNGGATGRGGGTGSRWSPSELDEPLMLGCRDIVAYFHLALSHKSFDFDFINNFSSDKRIIRYRCGLTHISTERSNVDFSLLLFGINFESRLTRKTASQAIKCAHCCFWCRIILNIDVERNKIKLELMYS